MPTIDELAPSLVRAKQLDLTLDPEADAARAFHPVAVLVSYARCKPFGIGLPMIFEVQGPSSVSYQRRTFTRTAPTTIIWTPKERGRHLVILREAAHHRWWSSLEIQVSGELSTARSTVDPQRSPRPTVHAPVAAPVAPPAPPGGTSTFDSTFDDTFS